MPANDSANDKEHERRRRREINHPGQSGPPQATQWRFGAAGLAVVVVDDVMVAGHELKYIVPSRNRRRRKAQHRKKPSKLWSLVRRHLGFQAISH